MSKWNWKEKREKNAFLVLEDGTVFQGYSIGANVDKVAGKRAVGFCLQRETGLKFQRAVRCFPGRCWTGLRAPMSSAYITFVSRVIGLTDLSPLFYVSSDQTWVSDGYVCRIRYMGLLGLYLGTSIKRKFNNWRKDSFPCVARMWGFVNIAMVLGVQCLCLDKIPCQLHLLVWF